MNKHIIDSHNLSIAWAEAFMLVSEKTGGMVSPLVVTIRGLEDGIPQEDAAIRAVLSEALSEKVSRHARL